MRLWSLNPKYLDARGLVALWREGLLAQKVLAGKTKGYRNHPQLDRFKTSPSPQKAMGRYLLAVWEESINRGYSFDRRKIKDLESPVIRIAVNRGQLRYEWEHLQNKLRHRDPARFRTLKKTRKIIPHPLFRAVAGGVAKWEKKS